MSFQEQMEIWMEQAKEKALLEQVCEFLDQFLPSDTRAEVKKIKTRHGAVTVEVDQQTVEKFRSQLVGDIDELVKSMEAL